MRATAGLGAVGWGAALVLLARAAAGDADLILFAPAVFATAPSKLIAIASPLPSLTGAVEKRGAGALTLRGTNSYAGMTRVLAGSLVGDTQSLQGDIDVGTGTTLAFDQSFTGSFTGLLGGAGALEKRSTSPRSRGSRSSRSPRSPIPTSSRTPSRRREPGRSRSAPTSRRSTRS
jgi:autotransporter-associated beta strand protein